MYHHLSTLCLREQPPSTSQSTVLVNYVSYNVWISKEKIVYGWLFQVPSRNHLWRCSTSCKYALHGSNAAVFCSLQLPNGGQARKSIPCTTAPTLRDKSPELINCNGLIHDSNAFFAFRTSFFYCFRCHFPIPSIYDCIESRYFFNTWEGLANLWHIFETSYSHTASIWFAFMAVFDPDFCFLPQRWSKNSLSPSAWHRTYQTVRHFGHLFVFEILHCYMVGGCPSTELTYSSRIFMRIQELHFMELAFWIWITESP